MSGVLAGGFGASTLSFSSPPNKSNPNSPKSGISKLYAAGSSPQPS